MRNKLFAVLIGSTALVMASSGAIAQTPQANTITACVTVQNDGTAFNAYPAKLNATLGLRTISTITGVVHGQNWKSGLPETRTIGSADWRNGGYEGGSFGSTGGWKSAFFYSGPKPAAGQEFAQGKDLIDIRFGSQDGISPGKAAAPGGTQPLYIVQRNRDMGLKDDGMTLAGFNLQICGTR